jgi:sterol desaturase/sphingolipid hydroxylase (fatty acid hydroxylase superfamily)
MGAAPLLISWGLLAVFAVIELSWIKLVRHGTYPWSDAAVSIGVKIGETVARIATAGLLGPVYFWVWDYRLWTIPLDGVVGWVFAFLMLEFLYYWEHRMHHEVRWMWAGHRAHHSSNQINLPAAARLSWTGMISGTWLFFLPLVGLGVHPHAMLVLLFINLTYQLWLHTEIIPKLGPLEWVLNTPSHHRVHHAANPRYLDKNYGGVLIVFDRLFGTFAEERADEPCRYGLVKPEVSRNPFVIVLREYANILGDLRRAGSLGEVARNLVGPPGGSPVRRGDMGHQLCVHGHK